LPIHARQPPPSGSRVRRSRQQKVLEGVCTT
jgi:hypothetical protein